MSDTYYANLWWYDSISRTWGRSSSLFNATRPPPIERALKTDLRDMNIIIVAANKFLKILILIWHSMIMLTYINMTQRQIEDSKTDGLRVMYSIKWKMPMFL